MFSRRSEEIFVFLYFGTLNLGRSRRKIICSRGCNSRLCYKKVGPQFFHCIHVILCQDKTEAPKNKDLCKQFYLVAESSLLN